MTDRKGPPQGEPAPDDPAGSSRFSDEALDPEYGYGEGDEGYGSDRDDDAEPMTFRSSSPDNPIHSEHPPVEDFESARKHLEKDYASPDAPMLPPMTPPVTPSPSDSALLRMAVGTDMDDDEDDKIIPEEIAEKASSSLEAAKAKISARQPRQPEPAPPPPERVMVTPDNVVESMRRIEERVDWCVQSLVANGETGQALITMLEAQLEGRETDDGTREEPKLLKQLFTRISTHQDQLVEDIHTALTPRTKKEKSLNLLERFSPHVLSALAVLLMVVLLATRQDGEAMNKAQEAASSAHDAANKAQEAANKTDLLLQVFGNPNGAGDIQPTDDLESIVWTRASNKITVTLANKPNAELPNGNTPDGTTASPATPAPGGQDRGNK